MGISGKVPKQEWTMTWVIGRLKAPSGEHVLEDEYHGLVMVWADTSGSHAGSMEDLITSRAHGQQSGGSSGAEADGSNWSRCSCFGPMLGPPKTKQLE